MKIIFRAVRLEDWWNYVIPPILGWFFLSSWYYQVPVAETLETGLLLWLISIATAAFGFMLNDFTDIREDVLKGEPNALTNVPAGRVVFFLAGLLVIQGVLLYVLQPWLLMFVHLLQVALLVIYSMRPFRLKRIWWIAPALDALFSGTLYYIFAFFILPVRTGLEIELQWMLFIFIWGICRGARNILWHMYRDAEADRNAELHTIIHHLNISEQRMNTIAAVLNLVEIALFIILIFSQQGWSLVWWTTAALFLIYLQLRKQQSREMANSANNLILEVYLPVMSIIALFASGGPVYFVLLIVVAAIFPTIMSWFLALFRKFRDGISKAFGIRQ